MSELSREQCENLKKWGMPQKIGDNDHIYVSDGNSVPYLLYRISSMQNKFSVVALDPTEQQLREYCIKLCQQKWGEDFLELNMIYCRNDNDYQVWPSIGKDDISYRDFDAVYNVSLSLALYALVEKIKEGK